MRAKVNSTDRSTNGSTNRSINWRMMLLAMVLLAALLAVPGCWGASEPDLSLETIRQTGKITVGVDPSYPPFEYYDGEDNIVGYDLDLTAEICSRLGATPSYVLVDLGGIVDALIAKKIDVIISSMPLFPEYGKQLGYSQPYFNAGQVLVTPADKAAMRTLADLEGKVVAVESGSAGELALSEQQNEIEGMTVKPLMTAQQALSEAESGRVDAVVVDYISAAQFISATATDSSSAASTSGLVITDTFVTDEPFVIATRKKDKALLLELDRILLQLREEGMLQELQGKWL